MYLTTILYKAEFTIFAVLMKNFKHQVVFLTSCGFVEQFIDLVLFPLMDKPFRPVINCLRDDSYSCFFSNF